MTEQFGLHIEDPETDRKRPRNESVVRIYFLMAVFMVGFIVLAGRLFVIQVLDSEQLKEQARIQYEHREPLKPTRGLILDRNLSILASNISEYTIAVDPRSLKRPDTVMKTLARYLPGSYQTYMRRIKNTSSRYVVLEKGIPESHLSPLKAWKCYGVFFDARQMRKYNFNSLAGPVIGYTDINNQGQSGIELAMQEELAGKDGFIVYQLNARRVKRPEVEYPHKDPADGNTMVLTIDQAYQAIAEEELAKGVEKYAAESGRCIIMQPKTGEILAMANNPSMNPNNRAEYSPEKARNRVITDLYEPGSTFKIVAMSAALNEDLYKPEDMLFAENGTWHHTSKEKPIVDDHPYGRITLRGAFEHSSNIVSAKIAQQMGRDLFYKYARNFGFGIKTGIELPGELSGDLRNPIRWDANTHLYMAFGYGLSATSLQIASAYAAIANDGVLMRPFIRKWQLDENRNIIDETVPQTVRRVVSSETAATMREFMLGVVDSGTARSARIEGLAIGGKTGTSQRVINGNYSKTSHVASFVGFFPVDDPRILILVILDAPKNGYYGGAVAAPIFREIAMRITNSSGEFAKRPDPIIGTKIARNTAEVPDLRGIPMQDAMHLAESRGFTVDRTSTSGIILSQEPQPGTVEKKKSIIRLRTVDESKRKSSKGIEIPELRGMSMRQAAAILKRLHLDVKMQGSGLVTDQLPCAGTIVKKRYICTLYCEARTVAQANLY